MERPPKFKSNMSTYHCLNSQHKLNETRLERNHLLNVKFYNYREEMFNRKLDHLRQSIEQIHPYLDGDDDDEINDQQTLTRPTCFTRVKAQFHLLNLSSQTQQRLLCQPPLYTKTSKQISTHLPPIPHRTNMNTTKQCTDRVSMYQTRLPTIYSCRSNSKNEKCLDTFRDQQINNEYKNQLEYDERKAALLKQFDELKHTINDPHSTLSALAALSRALFYLDSAMK